MFLGIALIVVAILFFRSPLAPAAADAIRHHNGIPIRRDEPADEKLAEILEEVSQLREHVTELAERMDFTERMLADVRRRDVLQNPRS